MLQPTTLNNIRHPFIDSMYMKKEFGRRESGAGMNILVIEARPPASEEDGNQIFLSFLSDLDLIKEEVERKSGKFSRVDIRLH